MPECVNANQRPKTITTKKRPKKYTQAYWEEVKWQVYVLIEGQKNNAHLLLPREMA